MRAILAAIPFAFRFGGEEATLQAKSILIEVQGRPYSFHKPMTFPLFSSRRLTLRLFLDEILESLVAAAKTVISYFKQN